MYPNFYLTSIAACLLLTLTTSAEAANPLYLQQANFKDLQQQFSLLLPETKIAKPASDALHFIKQRRDQNQISHIRMQQEYAGFLVYGGYAIIHSPESAKNLLSTKQEVQMNGVIYQGLATELGQPSNDFVKNGRLALDHFKTQYQDKDLMEEQVIPIVYIDDQQVAHWAYKLSAFIRHYDKIPQRPTAIVDAQSYKPFLQWDDVKTATNTPVKGMGFGGNTKVGEIAYGKNFPLLDLTRNKKKELCYMETPDVKIVDMQHDYTSSNKAMKFNCAKNDNNETLAFWTGYEADGYDKENGAFSPTNDALYAGYVIKHLYLDWYHIDVLTKRKQPMQLIMRVHYGEGYDNAYWDGSQMTFGDGDNTLYPLVSLGLGAHEISHGFTEQHSDLEYINQSGGLNESFSDMAAQAAEFYSNGVSSWQIGYEIVKEGSGLEALRYMDLPSRDGKSIDSADKYHKDLDVHYSSGVFNRLFYLMAHQPGWDTRKAFDVMVKANMDWWTPYTNFEQAGCGVLMATRELGFSVDEVKKSLNQVAVRYAFCNIIPPKS